MKLWVSLFFPPHWYSMAPATRDFGYMPKVSMDEGLERLRAALHAD